MSNFGGVNKEFPECGGITPAEYFAIEMEKAANDCMV